MKYLLLLALGMGLTATLPVLAQRTILNPKEGFKENSSNLTITRVELRDTVTVLYFRTKAYPGDWIRIPANTYIQPAGDTVKYFVKRTEGIPFNQEYYMPDSGVARYAVIFPAINKNTAILDYGEDASGGWKIYDIQLTRPATSLIPDFLNTEWYDRNTGETSYAFYDSVAVFDGILFDYAGLRKKDKNSYTVSLRNKEQRLELSISRLSDSVIRITKNGVSSVYLNDRKGCTIRHDDALYTAPVLKAGTAFLSGYVKNYNPKHFPRSMVLYVNDILAGNQESLLIEIAPDGRFSKEIPLYNPEEVFGEYGRSRVLMYLEPGRRLFVIPGGEETRYMGNLAGINDDLQRVEGLRYFDYNRVSNAPVMSPDSFKTYVFDCGKRGLHVLDSIYARKEIGQKAYQVKQTEIRYNTLNTVMEYHYIYHDAPPYPAGYLNFITPAIANDPLAYLSTSYYFFINRIKFAEPLRTNVPYTYNFREMIEAFKRSGVPLSDNDKKIILRLTPDGTGIQSDSADTPTKTLLSTFDLEHSTFVQKFTQRRSAEIYYRRYDSALSLSSGCQAVDIMRAQDILSPIVENLTPEDDPSLKEETAVLQDPFIRTYVFEQNEKTIRQLAANKNASGYTVNATPLVTADKIFDSIVAKYRGKVVYVDFWATWCGPCRAGIKEIGPLKEELKDENVAFVYITNETSPEATYKNMIPTIKGEHYRLKQDEFNYLSAKFQITGIPHYVLVDKEGKIVNPNLGFSSNQELKGLFEKYR
jgi:thiol-disulfide isomerase/thioredoxin